MFFGPFALFCNSPSSAGQQGFYLKAVRKCHSFLNHLGQSVAMSVGPWSLSTEGVVWQWAAANKLGGGGGMV